MAPPLSKKTETEKKAQRAKKARERRERKKTAKAQADETQAGGQESTPAPSNPASSPVPGQENDAPEPQYDVTAHGAKTVNRKRAAPAEDEAPEKYRDDTEDDDDIDLTDFDHLAELVNEVTKLKLERIELDKEEVNAEKKYNMAKRLYEAGTLSKKAFDVIAQEWETALETGVAAHEARKVRLVNLEVRYSTPTSHSLLTLAERWTDGLNRMISTRSSAASPRGCSSPASPRLQSATSLKTSRTCRCITAAACLERGMNTNNAKPRGNRKRSANPESKRLPTSGLLDSDATARTSTSSSDLSRAKPRTTPTIRTRTSRQLHLFSPAFS